MAHITLSGTLLDPTSELAVGDQVRFTHKSTTGETIKSAVSLLTIPPTGDYSIDLQYGLVLVEYKDVRKKQFKNLGVATVNQDNPATSIPELLNALVPVSSAELIEFQAILADCVAAQAAAEAAASLSEAFAGQLTTLEIIASSQIYASDVKLNASGFDVSGDGGGGSWVQNGVTGQTPSQSPTQIGDNLINDANGNQWELVKGQILNYNGTQWFPSPFGDFGNGGYLFDSNGWVYVSLINDLSQSYTFPTVAAFKASSIEFPDGKNIHLQDRKANFLKIAGTSTGDGIIVNTAVSQRISLVVVNNEFTDQQIGIVKDTDSTTAFLEGDSLSAANGYTFKLTMPFEISSKYNPTAGVIIRGTYKDSDAIKVTVAGDGVEIGALCDIDGLVFDGGKVGTARVTAGAVGCLFGVNGGLTYLEKFKVGRIKVINDPRRTAICVVNISDGEIGPFETNNTDGHAVLMSGIKDTKIKDISTVLNGDLNVNGSRLGSGLAFFREANAGKAPAQWYVSGDVLDTTAVRFANVKTFKNTDTATYVHNDSSQTVFQDIEIDSVVSDIAGKDGIKVRSNVVGFTCHATTTTKIAGKGVAVEASCRDINIPTPTISATGYDAVGDITGTPAPFTGGTGLGESLQDLTAGAYVENCFRVSILGAVIRGVARNPFDDSDGHGVRVVGTDNSDITAITSNIGGSHSRISGCEGTNVLLNAEVDSSSVANPATIYFSDDGFGPSSHCKAELTVTADGTTDTTYPIRVNGACIDIETSVKGDVSNYTRVDGLTVRVDVTASNVTYAQAFEKVRNENVNFDGSGLGTLTFGKTLAVPFVSAAPVGSSIFLTQLFAVGTVDATIRLLDTSFAVVPSVTRVVAWTVKQSMETNGWA